MPNTKRKEKSGTIQCITCFKWLDFNSFYIRKDNNRPYSRCIECHVQHTASRLKLNPPTCEQRRKWYRKSYSKKWYQKDVHASTQAAKEYGVLSDLTSEEWLSRVEEFNYKCSLCGCELTIEPNKVNTITLEHTVPPSRGGLNTKDNVTPACFFCNSAKRNLTTEEFKVMVNKWSKLL